MIWFLIFFKFQKYSMLILNKFIYKSFYEKEK
jgi:hypothetical protein